MAFNLDNLARISSSANTNAPVLFSYVTSADALATVKGAGYFNDLVPDLTNGVGKVKIGDVILVAASDDQDQVRVTDVTTNVEVTNYFDASFIDDGGLTPAKTAVTEGNVIIGNASNYGSLLDGSTDTQILVGNGTTMTSVALSSDVTMANDGAVTIENDAITTVKILDGAITNPKLGVVPGTATVSKPLVLDAAMSVAFAPTTVANTSMTPFNIAYNYLGATNTGTDLDNYLFRGAITQTSSNALTLGNRGYIMGMRSDVHVDGYIDDAYSMYAKMYVDGTSTVNQLYGINNVVATGSDAITMDETGNIAGVGISMNGTGDITCGGTGYGKLSGVYINWNETNAMTVDTCGLYLGVATGATLDAGLRVNASGTLTSTLKSHNTSGTITNLIQVVANHDTFATFDDATGNICTESGSAATTWAGRIKVVTPDGNDAWINVYSTSNA